MRFLCGCGLPDALIDYLPSLLNQPIQFYTDESFARRLHTNFKAREFAAGPASIRCFRAT